MNCHHRVRVQARWHTPLTRVAESVAAYLPIGAFTVLMLLGGTRWLYHWARPAAAAHDALARANAPYPDAFFFEARMIAVLAIWAAFAVLLRRRSAVLSAAFLLVFPFSFSMASIDWLVSIAPGRTAGAFGLYNIAGLLSAAVAAISAGVIVLDRKGAIEIDANDLQNLGKLLLGSSTVWAYLWFSEFLPVWYAYLPGENAHYGARLKEHFLAPFFLSVFLNWAIPFALLLRQTARRSEPVLLTSSILILAGRWLDIHLQVVRAAGASGPGIGIVDVAVFLGLGTAFIFSVDRTLARSSAKPDRSHSPIKYEFTGETGVFDI